MYKVIKQILHASLLMLTATPLLCFSQNVIITEFMAINSTGIKDEDGDRNDWIEIYNAGSEVVNLGGWHLTDKADDLTKWTFYPTILNPGEFRIVWASNKNRKDPDDQLHTNFKLSGNGEYLALVNSDGVVTSEFATEYPAQVDDVSYGRGITQSVHKVIASNSVCQALVPTDDSLSLDWTYENFDDSSWTFGHTGIGYDSAPDYHPYINLDVQTIMKNIHSGIYIRIPFVIPDGISINNASLEMRYDDGFRAYFNGYPSATANLLGDYTWNESVAGWTESEDSEEFTISNGGIFHSGTNMLAIHGVNAGSGSSDFLIFPELTIYTTTVSNDQSSYYFTAPTPGSGNLGGTEHIGPQYSKEQHVPNQPAASEDLNVSVKVIDAEDGVTSVSMTYQVMYTNAATVPMFDDGLHGDDAAGDSIYGAIIPSAAYNEGEMIRYRFEAMDGSGNASRWPIFHDPLQSPEFFGTMAGISVISSMPVYHWFVDDSIYGPDTRNESRSSLFFGGKLYDNIMTRTRGGSTESATIPKKSFKFDFNRGEHFQFDDEQGKVEEMNLNTTYTDKTYLRRMLSWNTFEDAGAPGCISFLVHLRRNNKFFGVQNFEEQVDDDYLQRRGFDEKGALYKIRGCPTTTKPYNDLIVGKATREFEGNEDIETHISSLQGGGREDYIFDHMNLAGVLNYMALITLINDGDVTRKNHYYYRDTEGSGDWHVFPWDKDLTFGRRWVPRMTEDEIGSSGLLCYATQNILIDAVWNDPDLQALYLRRYRTLVDRFLQPASTPANERHYENMIHELLQEHGTDLLLDYNKWGNPWAYDSDYTPGEANTNFTMNIYLNENRSSIFANPDLPAAQTGSLDIRINRVEAIPASGNQAEEYIELYNAQNIPVDISGWSVSNAVSHVLESGSIIPANGFFYISPDTGAFRRRTVSPKSGERLFVQGSYKGMLSSRGETLDLYDSQGVLRDSETWAADLSEAQNYLRISEVMYNPALPEGSDLTEDRLEFVELINTGTSPLDISGTFFTAGLIFTNPAIVLPPGGYLVVASDPVEFANQYNISGMTVVGPFSGYLSNGSDAIELEDGRGETIQRFEYKDSWHKQTDGDGFSLTLIDPANTNSALWNDQAAWRPSLNLGGSPGTDDVDHIPDSIIINEILAHSDTGGDWLELKNMTDAAIDLSFWFISDDKSDLQKYQLPSNSTLPANGLMVIHESSFNSGSKAFALSELGDELILNQALSNGMLQGYQTSRYFNASGKDISLGRWIDSEGDEQFIPMNAQTPGAENGDPKTGPVLITEIMYSPSINMAEYIELHNSSTETLSLFDSEYPTNSWSLSGAIDFSFPSGTTLDAGESLIVCNTNSATFRAAYASVKAGVQVFGPFNGKFNNAGERICLNYPGNPEPTFVPLIQLESVNYKPASPWPTQSAGQSIERISTTSPANDPGSWKLSGKNGSPGLSGFSSTPIQFFYSDWKDQYFGNPALPESDEFDDFDLDGQNNLAELIAGTNPTNAADKALLDITVLPNGNIQVSILTRVINPLHGLQRYYTLEQKLNLTEGSWQAVPGATDISATGSALMLEQAPTNSSECIRAQIELK